MDDQGIEVAEQRIAKAFNTNAAALDLSSLGLESLPDTIGQLTNLQNLNVNSNQLTELPDTIGQLTKLERLNAESNRLTKLPRIIRDLTNLKIIDLHDNQALDIPPEILGPSYVDRVTKDQPPADAGEILQFYFERLKGQVRQLNEAKILIVGQGEVGKTSLVKCLTNGKFDPKEQKTEGINITPWEIDGREANDDPVRLNIWDFGGQEIMHATHQFFLTKRSLYLIVLSARDDEAKSNLHYWLSIAHSYGGDSPIIIVINKSEPPNQLDLNETRLLKDFAPNLRGIVNTSCEMPSGLDELWSKIRGEILELPHVFDLLPESYFKTKAALECSNEDYLDYREYEELCEQHGVTTEQDRFILLRFLHDLGNMLNFHDPDAPYQLKETNILKPEWVTDGVYRIINNKELIHAGGVLELKTLGRVLTDKQRFPKERHRFIVDMMRKFELCFDFPDAPGEKLLIPEQLSPNEPDVGWDESAALNFQTRHPQASGWLCFGDQSPVGGRKIVPASSECCLPQAAHS